ncbi:MAG: flagellar hook-associated protein FlgK [Lachnospiraceae bacterium]
MSLMGSLYVGTSGLQTSQNALNTTAHNLSNLETAGYVRQQVLLGDRVYTNIGNSAISIKQTGLGVEYSKVRQVRDAFLDASYRKESGRSAFYEVCYETTSEMETLLGELEGASFKTSLTNLWESVEELQKDPTSAVVQGQFVSSASEFLERAQAVYDGLISYQDNLNAQVKDIVNKINKYGQQIYEYNLAIKKVELGSEEANDLRDARNLILDKLSGLVNMSYSEDKEGMVEVSIEGATFVLRDRVYKMDVTQADGTDFYTPVWPQNDNAQVFNTSQEISSDLNTDIGQLKSILLARGDRRANYTDLAESTYKYGGTDASGNKIMATSGSLIMNIQAEFDNLIHGIVTKLNNILTGETSVIDGGGTPSYTNKDACGLELFVRLGTGRYEEVDDGFGNITYQYVAEDTSGSPSDVSTMYTLSNLKINPDLLKQPSLLSFVTADKEVDQTKADALAAAFKDDFSPLNPYATKANNFSDYYSELVGQVGNTGYVYGSISENQQAAVESLENARQAVMGVSSSEELTNMIKFQNAFNAASRYINAVNEMLGHIIERLG